MIPLAWRRVAKLIAFVNFAVLRLLNSLSLYPVFIDL